MHDRCANSDDENVGRPRTEAASCCWLPPSQPRQWGAASPSTGAKPDPGDRSAPARIVVPNFDLDTLEEVARMGAMPEFGYCTVSPAWQ